MKSVRAIALSAPGVPLALVCLVRGEDRAVQQSYVYPVWPCSCY